MSAGGGGTPLQVLFKILGIAEGKAALKPISDELVKIQTTADQVGAKLGKALAPANIDTSKIKGLATDMDKAGASTDKLAASSTKATSALNQEGTAAKNLSTSTSQVGVNVDKINQSNEKVSNSSTKATKALKEEATEFKKVGDESSKATGNIEKGNQALDKTAASANKTGAATKTLSSSFTASMGAVTSLSGGLVSLWSTYDSLGDAQLKVDASTLKLSKAQEMVTKTTEKLNELIAKGVTSGAEYEQAQLDVSQAHDMVAVAQGRLVNSQEDLNLAQANFYTQIIPQGIAVMGSLVTLFATAGDSLKGFGGKLKEFGTQLVSTDRSMRLISLTNPFFIALTVGGAIVTAFATNLFGFRDAINWVGKALGDVIGPLKPFLTLLGDLGKGFTDFVNGGTQEAQAFETEVSSSMEETSAAITTVSTTANRTVGDLKRYGLDVSTAFINAKGEVVGFKTDFSKAVGEAADATKGLATQTGTSVDDSINHLGRLTTEFEKTKKEWEATFSKSFDLGSGIKLSGFGQLEPGTPSNLSTETKDRSDQGRLSQLALDNPGPFGWDEKAVENLQKLSSVTTMYNSLTKELYVNKIQLDAAMKKANLTTEEAANVEKVITQYMNGTLVATSQNISGWENLAAEVEKNNAASGKLTSRFDTLGNSIKPLNPILKTTGEATAQVGGAMIATADAVDMTGVSISVAAQAYNRLTTDLEAAYNEQAILTKATGDYKIMLDTAVLGTIKQQNAMKQQQMTLIETVAGLNEYNKQLGTTEGQQTAMYQGMANQLDVLVKSKVALWETIGTLAELNRQFETGEPQMIAYTTAFTQAFVDFKNAQIAVYAIRGEIAALEQQMAKGEAQVLAYQQGFENMRKNLLEDANALHELDGALQAVLEAMAKGELAATDMAKGVREQFQALVDGRRELDTLKGALQEYHAELASGFPQYNAMNKALLEQEKSFASVKEAVAANIGVLTAYKNSLHDIGRDQDLMNEGFTKGSIAAYEWRDALISGKSEQDGYIGSLVGIANEMGITVPDAFLASSEAVEDFIAIQMGMPEAIDKGIGEAVERGKKALDSLIEAFDKGDNLSGKEMKDIFGFELPDKVEKELELDLKFKLNEPVHVARLDALFGNIFTNKNIKLNPDEANTIADDFMGQINTALKKGEISQGFADTMQSIFDAMPSPTDTAAWDTWTANYSSVMDALQKGDVKKAQEIMTAITTGQEAVINAAKGYTDLAASLDAYNAAKLKVLETEGKSIGIANGQVTELVDTYDSTKGGDQTGGQILPNGMKNPNAPVAGPDTKGLDTAMAKMATFTQALALLGPATGVAVAAANAEFAKLNPLQPATTTAFTNYATAVSLMGGAAKVGVDAANVAFDLLNPAGPGFQTNVATFGSVLNTFGPAANAAVTAANVEFDLLNPAGPGFQANVAVFGSVLATMGPATTVAVDAVNLELERLGEPLATVALPAFEQFVTDVNEGPFADLQNNAAVTGEAIVNIFEEETSKIPDGFESAADDINSGAYSQMQRDAATTGEAIVNIFREEAGKIAEEFEAAADDVNAAFDSMEQKAGSVMDSIVQSANDAANAVGAVVNIINQMEDKTVTLTTIHEDVYTTRQAAAGFGPTVVDHPTMLMVGESGPEYVNVTPLSTSAGKNYTAQERLALYADPGNKGLNGGLGFGGPPDQDTVQNGYDILYLAQGTTSNTYTGVGGFPNTQTNVTGSNSLPGGVIDTRILYVGNKSIWTNGIPVEVMNAGVFGTGGVGTGTGGGGSNGGATGMGNFGGNSSSTQTNTGTGGNITQTQTNTQNGTNNVNNQNDVNTNSNNTGGGSTGGQVGVSPGAQNNGPISATPNNGEDVVLNNGQRYTVYQWNDLSDSQKTQLAEGVGIKYMPSNTYLEEDYSISWQTAGNGGLPGNGTGANGNNGGNANGGNTGTGSFGFTGTPGPGEKVAPTGYVVPESVQTSGGPKWDNPNMDPNTWRSVEMTDPKYKGKWKVVDDKGVNIFANLDSQDEADEVIQDHKTMYIPPGGSNGGAGGTPGTPGYTRRPYTDANGVARGNPNFEYSQIADVGVSPAVRGKVKQLPGINMRNEVELANGDRYTVEEWNSLSDPQRKALAESQGFFAIPEGAFLEEDYSITPNYYQRPLNSRSGPNPYDPNATRPTTPGTPGTPGTGGNGNGGNANGGVNAANLEALKFPGSNVYASSAAPAGATFGRTNSGRWVANQTGANLSPEDWFIEKRGNKFIIRDGQNRDVAVDFNTLADAQNFINFYITDMERKNPGQEFGEPTIPLYKDKTTGKIYSQDAAGNLYQQNGNFSDYGVDTGTHANPIPNTGGGAGNGGSSGGGSSGGGSNGGNGGSGAGGNNGGGGASGGNGVGGTVPGYNGNFNYQVNGRQLKIEGGKVVVNTLTADDMIQAKAAFKRMTGLDLNISGGSTPPNTPPTTPSTGNTGTNFNPGFSNGVGNAPINGGFPGLSNLYRPLSGQQGVGGGGIIIGNPPTGGGGQPGTPGTPGRPGLPGWLDNLFGGIFGNIFGNIATGGSNQSISRQWTDANGNNFNVQSDINTTNQVNTGTGGNITQTQSNTSNGGASAGMNVNPNGIINMGGMIVDGQTGKVTMPNGMIVDGSTGTVIIPNTGGNGNGTIGGGGAVIGDLPTDAFGNPYSPYPTRARTGSAAEGIHSPWRSGQDLTKPFFDWMAPAPYVGAATSGVLGSNLNPATGGTGGNGGNGLPDIQHWMDWINNIIANAFKGIVVNLSSVAMIDSSKVYESQQKYFGMKLGTLIK